MQNSPKVGILMRKGSGRIHSKVLFLKFVLLIVYHGSRH